MNKVIQSVIYTAIIFGISGCQILGGSHQVYINLGNPTQYLFNADQVKVNTAIAKLTTGSGAINGTFLIPHVMRLYKTFDNQIRIVVYPCYSSSYWSGPQETDVEWPEAGRIGQIEADFIVTIVPQGQQTLVTVEVKEFVQQIGRKYALFPDFHKTGIRENVKSDTYFEYTYLRRLGEELGETNMPVLKCAVISTNS
jgi:hypothetical protein